MKLRGLSLLSVCCAALALFLQAQFHKGKAGGPDRSGEPILTPPEKWRAPEQTFLTYPEWYLVYSPDEYADFIVDKPPSEFPYLGHLGQFWQGYWTMYSATRDDYPFNVDYHVMVMVIGTSTSVEYGLKWIYENLVGRLAEATRRHGGTAEEKLAADVARDYVSFLDVEPWYKFDFIKPLKRVWTETSYWGPDPIRKWERKYFLTSEYAAKGLYAWLIKKASESFYGTWEEATFVRLNRAPAASPKDVPAWTVQETYPDGSVLVKLPRYQAFTRDAQMLSKSGLNFLEIAGNRDLIQVSAVIPSDFDVSGLRILLTQPILTRPGSKRILFTVAVPELAATLRKLDQPPFRLEHIYDY